jgi:selenocysteine-specific elongation factor
MIIATAGHVDHGKTSLIRALTGVDTDRLAEEKQRGMSIDLGFAYADLGAAEPVCFVDVPGHERFARNMLVGVARIDLALIVVAADDGPMPQTREHLNILQLLGVPACVVVLSKLDRVDDKRRTLALQELTTLLADSPWAGAPVWPVVLPSGQGVAAVREHLATRARTHVPPPATGAFRMAVDRSFTLAGAGRIVTGAVLSGSVQVGDAVRLSPQGAMARVRGLHAQNQPAQRAQAGQRCAINLAGLETQAGRPVEPARGDWVLAPGAHVPTGRLDVWLQVLPGESRGLVHRSPVQLHIGAAAVAARIALLDGSCIAPGSSGRAQLVLTTPVAACHGDCYILRDAATQRTVGGGRVLDPFGPARGRSKQARQAQLDAWAFPDPAAALHALLAATPEGLPLGRFAQARNLRPEEAVPLHQLPGLHWVQQADGLWAMSEAHWQALCKALHDGLTLWHAAEPDRLGPTEAALLARTGHRYRPAWARSAVARMVAEGRMVRQGLCLRLVSHHAVLGDSDQALLDRVAALWQPAGLRPPIVGELAAALALPLPDVMVFLQRAEALGQLVRVAPNRYYLPQSIPALQQVAVDLATDASDSSFDAAAYRDRSGIGRNLTIQVLEFLDREGYTRFDGKRRWPLA